MILAAQMSRRRIPMIAAVAIALLANGVFYKVSSKEPRGGEKVSKSPHGSMDRSPVDLATSPDGKWIVTANQIADTASLIRVADWKLVDEVACGSRPADVEFVPDRDEVVITSTWSGQAHILRVVDEQLQKVAAIDVGFEPHGIAIHPDGSRAYVGLVASAQVAEIDLVSHKLTRRFDVGNWPRYLTLTHDGKRLAVGNAGDGNIQVIDTDSGESLYSDRLANGINLGQMRTSPDGEYAYFTWMVYRTNPINQGNIQRGWILASRIGRVRLDGPAYREAISLDVPRQAVADPHDLVISDDATRMVASASGTHELLVYRLSDLPFVALGGPGDLIDRRLERDRERFYRIDVGGRPMGMRLADDQRTVYVANFLRNSVQVVDVEGKEIVKEIDLGGPEHLTLERQGMEIFYDGQRSLDQWYSCHSCHQDGGTNARPMDTMNDGSEMTLKTVLPLYGVTETYPWTWHGWQQDLTDAMHKSITSTMQGPAPTYKDMEALIAFLRTLETPPNPFRGAEGELGEAALRGKKIFYSRKAACVDCHNGPRFSDGQIHDVGSGSESDHYEGYNTPSLIGVHRKVRWLHSGRARTLERVINDLHSPEKVNGEENLTEEETADLIEYLKSL